MKKNKEPILARTYGSFSMRLAAVVLVIILFVVTLAGISLYQSKRQYEKQVMISTQNLSQVLDENIHQVINKTDLALLAIADEINRQIASGGINKQTLNAFIGKQKERLIVADSLRMANAEGLVSYGTAVETAPKTNIADRAHFTGPRDDPSVKLFISKPVITRIDKKWALPLSCRLSRPDGSFGGIVYANIDIKTFINMFSSLNIGSNGTIVMRDRELRIIARYPEPGGYGTTIGNKQVAPEELALIRAGAQNGSFRTHSALDKTERTYSFRKLSHYPLHVVVGRATGEYLSDWRQELTRMVTILLLFIAIVLYFWQQMIFRWKGELQAREDLRKANDDLENLIIERTAEVSKVNERLQVELGERKQAEAKSRSDQQFLQTVIDHSHYLIYAKDLDGKFILASQSLSKFFNQQAPEQLLGKTSHDFLPKEIADQHRTNDLEVIARQSVIKFEETANTKDGLHTFLTNKFPLFDGNGKIYAVCGASVDVTDLKRAEEEKAKLEAQNRQLQKAESLGRMAGAIAHTFNNQLGAVIGNLELALMDLPQDAEHLNRLTAAMQSAWKAAEVSGQMLTYLGQSFEKHELMNIAEACRRTLPILEASLPETVTMEINLPSPGPAVMANSTEIRQVLTNLITNAWEAIGEGRGSIHLNVKTVSPADIPESNRVPIGWQPKGSAYACLEITDTGDGISHNDIEILFDPFFSSKLTGRGLGLPVVLGIVKAHDGVVTVESEPGRGSAFRVFFPVSAEEAPSQAGKAAPVSEIAGSATIMLVEDEEMVRDMATAMLKRLGFSVLAAKDGVEAVELFRQHKDEIHLVISDLTMPRMDGWETLSALRQLTPNLPVILASGYDKAQVMAGDHPELPQVFLGKPYTRKGLGDAISQALINSHDRSGHSEE